MATLRADFLTRILSRKELSDSLPVDGSWIKSLESAYPENEFASLTAADSDKWIPQVRPALAWYQAGKAKEAGNADDAASRLRAGIEDSQGEAFDKPRGRAKADLAELLLASGKADEARQVLASITPAETSEPLKARLKILTDQISAKEQAKPK
jgi:thioredoxin-like negative regulator of GroEL